MKRGPLTITVTVCMMLAVALHFSLTREKKQDVVIQDYNTELSVMDSTSQLTDSLYQAQSIINIRMVQLQCKKCGHILENDSVYMQETAKLY